METNTMPPTDVEQNRQSSNGDDEKTLRGTRSRFSVVIENFSLVWFAVSMDTGILSLVMNKNPYQFTGLGIISTIMFVFNIFLFSALFLMLLLKAIMFPRTLWNSLTGSTTELGMIGGACIAYLSIVGQVGLTVSNASWGGHSFTIVAIVMWWIGTAATITYVVFALIIITKYAMIGAGIPNMTPGLCLPFVTIATNAMVGGQLANFANGISARLAVPTLIVGYLQMGIATFGSSMVFAAYLVRLINHGLPPMNRAPTLFLLAGPVGQAASAAVLLGSGASTHFGEYGRGTVLTSSGGSTFAAAGVLLGLLLLGLATVFAIFAIYVCIEGAFKRQHEYSMVWWAVIFPTATINTCCIALATAMDSPTFRALSSIILIALMIAYLVNCAFTLYYLLTGRALNGVTVSKAAAEGILGDGRKVE